MDPDLVVRQTFLRWIGAAAPPGAMELLKAQSGSADLGLRQSAIEALGALHTEPARIELHAEAAKGGEILRAAAVHALARWGIEEVIPFTHDASSIVRIAAAEELSRFSTVDAAVQLSELAVDGNADVQRAAIRAALHWPDSLAFPLLLQSMRHSSAKTRFDAAEQLASRRTITTPYRFDAPPKEREAAVIAIAREIGSSLSYLDQVLQKKPRALGHVNELRQAELREHLVALVENPPESAARTAAREWLGGITPADVPVVEAFLQRPTRVSNDAIYRDVLPKIDPAYAALLDLESRDVGIRRRGAKILALKGEGMTLSRPILTRLRERISHEEDETVWRSIMTALETDGTEESDAIVVLGLNHKSAEVRGLACAHVGRHGNPVFATRLLELLDDRDRNVRIAAARALGSCANQVAVYGLPQAAGQRPTPSLRSLLTNQDDALHFAAAVSLCRLGAADGMQELIRLTYDPRAKVRKDAVKEMGLSGQARFVTHLVAIGWTEKNQEVLAAILDSLDRLVPPEDRPAAIGDSTMPDGKIKLWARWEEERRKKNGANRPG